jgi:hypothetical protein
MTARPDAVAFATPPHSQYSAYWPAARQGCASQRAPRDAPERRARPYGAERGRSAYGVDQVIVLAWRAIDTVLRRRAPGLRQHGQVGKALDLNLLYVGELVQFLRTRRKTGLSRSPMLPPGL